MVAKNSTSTKCNHTPPVVNQKFRKRKNFTAAHVFVLHVIQQHEIARLSAQAAIMPTFMAATLT